VTGVRFLTLALLACVSIGLMGSGAALAAPPAHVATQESPNRPTADQPSPGTSFAPTVQDKPWSYNWVARPFVAIVALFIVALLLGFALRWVGVGRRTT
jgi:hypothetical protein